MTNGGGDLARVAYSFDSLLFACFAMILQGWLSLILYQLLGAKSSFGLLRRSGYQQPHSRLSFNLSKNQERVQDLASLMDSSY